RSAAAETSACSQVAEALALAFPHVAFEFRSDGRVLWRTSGNGRLRDVAAALYGPDFARGCVDVARETEGMAVEGLAGRPVMARASRTQQTLIVNGHAVRHAGIRAAVEAAYRGLVPARRFPAFILHLRLDPARVDVNVHPRKLEVRLAEERRVTGFVHHAVLAALKGSDLTPDWDEVAAARGGSPGGLPLEAAADAAPSARVRPGTSAPAVPPGLPYPSPAARARAAATPDRVAEAMRLFAAGEDARRMPALRYAGAVMRTYLIAEGPDGVYIVDQHAAHEKIYYEQFLREAGAARSQPLAVPLVLDVPPGRLDLLASRNAVWERFGVVAEPFGPASLVVRAIPAVFRGDPHEALRQLFEELLADDADPTDPRAAALALASCKAAVKARDPLSPEEAQALLDRLASLDEPFTCPHGRPTVWKITTAQLERYFGRRDTGARGGSDQD
ncbi:MAG: DNA mismatch repair protein MutL, partial [Clostridia bacterium]|nr:DNA mismatch repair protein MutL [Clostridia bacterium]